MSLEDDRETYADVVQDLRTGHHGRRWRLIQARVVRVDPILGRKLGELAAKFDEVCAHVEPKP